jgi:hypothetical protein
MVRKTGETEMSYITERESYGRTERHLDVPRFAADLAVALGGTIDPDSEDYGGYRKINLPDNLQLSISQTHTYGAGDREKVTLRLRPTDVPNDLHSSFYGAKYRLPEIHVSTARPMDKIAADIKRRLFTAAADPIAAQRETARQRQEYRNKLAESVAAMRQEFPQLDIRERDKDRAEFFSGSIGHYLSGQIHSDGMISIDRMGSVSREQFLAICRILNSGKAV